MSNDCLGYNSLIDTNKGRIEISKIVLKDLNVKIKTLNHKTKEIEYQNISQYVTSKEVKLLRVYLGKGCLDIAYNHKIFVYKSGYTLVGKLQVGDICITSNNDKLSRVKISAIKKINNTRDTYDLDVKNSNYFCNNILIGDCNG